MSQQRAARYPYFKSRWVRVALYLTPSYHSPAVWSTTERLDIRQNICFNQTRHACITEMMYPPDTGRPWSITPDSSYPRRPAPGGSPCPSHSAPSLIAFQFSYDLSKFVNMKTPIHTRLIYDAKSHTWNSHMQQICNTWYLHVHSANKSIDTILTLMP